MKPLSSAALNTGVGYALAALVGIALGLLGGGGSILTVPIFVYAMGYAPKAAIAMSLPVVGVTSAVGAAGHWRAGNLSPRIALAFGAFAMAASYATARLARHVPGGVQLVLLAIAMLGAGTSMLRRRDPAGDAPTTAPTRFSPALALAGIGVGLVTGLVGIGGGFLIVPALVLFAGVPMKRAVGTSLAVIAMNAAAGALGYHDQPGTDRGTVAMFTLVAVAGSLLGTRLVHRVPARALRRGFGIFLFALAAFILVQNRAALREPFASPGAASRR